MKKILSRFLTTVLVLLLLPPLTPRLYALEEYEVKAAFLYQFTKFVQWPEDAGSDKMFTICILGKDPFGDVLNQLEHQTVGDRQVNVTRMKDLENVQACELLFISDSEKQRIEKILEDLKGRGVLTVSEVEGFLNNGGVINFVKRGNKIKFEINQREAEHAGIKISSKLLSVASNVVAS
jgi:hypothetical protein